MSGPEAETPVEDLCAGWCTVVPLATRCWAGEYVVYSPLSGNTHFLDVLSGKILVAISSAPASESGLRRLTAEYLEVPDDESVAQHVADTLATLDELGLIERRRP